MADTGWAKIGKITSESVMRGVGFSGETVLSAPLADLKQAWQQTLDF